MTTPNEKAPVPDDHPDGPEIRRQVEFYFSDENLPTDLHLLQCCGGRENLPVSISRICGFKKMRSYKQKSLIVAALRKSAFLTVTEDGKQISRKVPLQGPCALDESFYEDDEITYDPRVRKPAVHPVPLLPQAKAEYPPGMTKNMMKPTGFEDTYVEAPITPDEAKDEEAMYDPDKSFLERIEIAIQRFKQKRRMHEIYANVFNKWMKFGGVECSQRMFGGLSKHDIAAMDKEEIAVATATHNVPWDRGDEKQWVTDFVGVGEAFMSSFFPDHYGFAPSQIQNGCKVLRSFYNYLLYHSVCPEYNDDLKKARDFCNVAEAELPKINNAGLALPGPFNTAASTIFGGSKAGTYIGDKEWACQLRKEGMDLGDTGVMDEEARITFVTGVTILGTDEQEAMLHTKQYKVLKDESFALEVVSITPSTTDTREMYSEQNKTWASKLRLEPLGVLACRSIHLGDRNEYDLPKDKYPEGCFAKMEAGKEFAFWVEDRVLQECFAGMKMHARILTLEGGITILDEVTHVMCSFYRWLPNELLMASRSPKEVVVRKKVGDDEEVDGKDQGDEGQVEGSKFADDGSDEE
ncbi:hypothetical protein P280DRAFT_513328 [Massarina eburnea CBS 473.64]|uniref:HTH La-type RNA-binding domain-containing protein n=1 Tax=Massarina eburnea CBS 473.64 TaxID=1395130 RepID=A0A6A6SEW3_9PLEO|nr:hypothetical protein P280DRAFT_513328 [Massarina eburnea CBS 473.64]